MAPPFVPQFPVPPPRGPAGGGRFGDFAKWLEDNRIIGKSL